MSDDVMDVIIQQIEARFRMPLDDLREAVAAAPQASTDAAAVVKWYEMLADAQQVLERAESALVAALDDSPGEVLDDPVMQLAHQVNAAVQVRDGRAMVVRHYLDPHTPSREGPGAWRGIEARPAPRTGPADRRHPASCCRTVRPGARSRAVSVRYKKSSQDEALSLTFGASLSELYVQASNPAAPVALTRALVLRSWLALAEEQVVRVRDRVLDATAAHRDLGGQFSEDLRFDAQWLEAALSAPRRLRSRPR
ncbi:hypothetical protein RB200_23335 [Streptomyces sp. PmtG]